jgi:hypothetical protein
MNEVKERVAAGLRNMKKAPDAFLFLDGWEGWTWDSPDILGIPVFHSTHIGDYTQDGAVYEVLFVPIWKDEHEEGQKLERQNFLNGYIDCKLSQLAEIE